MRIIFAITYQPGHIIGTGLSFVHIHSDCAFGKENDEGYDIYYQEDVLDRYDLSYLGDVSLFENNIIPEAGFVYVADFILEEHKPKIINIKSICDFNEYVYKGDDSVKLRPQLPW